MNFLSLEHIAYLFISRYETPVCESDARSKSTEIDDPFKDRELPGQNGEEFHLSYSVNLSCLSPRSKPKVNRGGKLAGRSLVTTHQWISAFEL